MRCRTALLLLTLGLFCAWGQPPSSGGQQAPPPEAPDPHENPELNGGDPNPPAAHRSPARPDPHAVPDPIPVRAPNLAAHPRDAVAHRPATDSEMMSQIRASLLKDKTVARYAGGVRVISHAGSVRLEGKVPSASVRETVERRATEVAGAGNVTNNLDIQPAPVKSHK